jgi:hypothetical protein
MVNNLENTCKRISSELDFHLNTLYSTLPETFLRPVFRDLNAGCQRFVGLNLGK